MIRLLLCLLLLVVPARAEMPAGHDDPAFQAALTAWLNGEDEAMLDIYRLAGDGNVAALIAYQEFKLYTSEADLPKIDYVWLDYAAESPLGLAYGLRWEDAPEQSPEERAEEFLELGEYRRAATLMRAETPYWLDDDEIFPFSGGMVRRVIGPRLTPLERLYTVAVVYRYLDEQTAIAILAPLCEQVAAERVRHLALFTYCEAFATRNWELKNAFWSALITHDPERYPYGHGLTQVGDWLVTRADLPHARLCERLCPDEMAHCAASVYRLAHQAAGLVSLRSRVETLVPQDVFITSRRADLALWQRLATVHDLFLSDGIDTGWSEAPQCLLRALVQRDNPWRTLPK